MIRKYENMTDAHESGTCELCATDLLSEKPEGWFRADAVRAAVGAVVFALSFFMDSALTVLLLLLFSALITGYDIALKGVRKLVSKKRLDMNFLMSTASIGAFSIGHWHEGTAILLLFFVAEVLEDYAGERSLQGVHKLMKLTPQTAKILVGDREVEMHVHDANPGDIAVVRPGETVPLDGIIEKGATYIDQANITGESFPVQKIAGDTVFAGTINQSGYIEIRVTSGSEFTVLAKIRKLIETAALKKTRAERFVDRFADYYTPSVVVMSIAVATLPHLVMGYDFTEWFYRGLLLLVVSSPCALVISTPIAMVSAITAASYRGILIKGGGFIEKLRLAGSVYFDKTGTLSKGELEVDDVIPAEGFTEEEVLAVCAALEGRSQHSAARAIVDEAIKRALESYGEVTEFEEAGGMGVKGVSRGKVLKAGGRKYFSPDILSGIANLLNDIENDGNIPVIVSVEDCPAGVIVLKDALRDESFFVVSELKKSGYGVYMLTGDNHLTAESISEELGLDGYFYGLFPDRKVEVIEEGSRPAGAVMIGDGINDAPALRHADVGIAMGSASDIALDSADIVLINSDLNGILYLFRIGRKTSNIVRENISVSAAIKLTLAVLAVLGIINLWTAVAAGDVGLTLAVILNSARLSFVRYGDRASV